MSGDSNTYQNRNNLYLSNANLFVANNNNPFLISPYSPPANLVKQSQIVNINAIISSITGNLSSILNFNTWELKISTITNTPYSDTLTISTTNINIEGSDTNISGDVTFPDNTFFNTISTVYIFASVANTSSLISNFITTNTLNTSSITTNSAIINSTFTSSTIQGANLNIDQISTNNIVAASGSFSSLVTNSAQINSTLIASSINVTGPLIFTTMTGSTINTNYITVNSTMFASTISTTNIYFETLAGSTMTTNSLTVQSTLSASSITTSSIQTNVLEFSSLCMVPSTISTFTGPATSSILICLNGSYWKIAIEPA